MIYLLFSAALLHKLEIRGQETKARVWVGIKAELHYIWVVGLLEYTRQNQVKLIENAFRLP